MKKQNRKSSTNKKVLDPKMGVYLCDECQSLGFCRLSMRDFENKWSLGKTAYRRWKEQVIMNDIDIQNLIPVKADFVKGKYTKEHYQMAFDAFHQQDYETAYLHFKAVEEYITDEHGVNMGIAVCLYFMKAYTEAADYASKRLALYDTSAIPFSVEKFIAHCENSHLRMLKEKELAEAAAKEAQTTLEQQENTLMEKLAEQKVDELLSECDDEGCSDMTLILSMPDSKFQKPK